MSRAVLSCLSMVVLTFLLARASAQTDGSVTFRVTTQPIGQDRDPKHVLAIWVSDSGNGFIKTLERRAARRIQYLYTWNAASDQNDVDAVTGATLNSHRTHEVTWDCRDTAGELVPDGNYRIRAEFTAAHEQGPLTPAAYLEFAKGPDPITLTPGDLPAFKDMSLVYTPAVVLGFKRGDADGDGQVVLADALAVLQILFGPGIARDCDAAADVNDNGRITLADVVALLLFVYAEGHAPAPPFPDCGPDPSPGSLDCSSLQACP